MEGDFLTELTIRPLTIGDLDAIVEIDRKVLGKVRRDFWKKKIELPNPRYPLSGLVAEHGGEGDRVYRRRSEWMGVRHSRNDWVDQHHRGRSRLPA